MNRQNENGNAIFLIIMGVALFAALGYAFTSSNRSSTNLVTDEQATAYANQIIAYGNEIKQAVKRLQLRGCDDTEIGFDNNIFKFNNGTNITGNGHNPNTNSDKCRIFKVEGGGLMPRILPAQALSLISTSPNSPQEGNWRAWEASIENVGSDENEIVYVSGFISEKVCSKINQLLNVTDGSIPIASGSIQIYAGSFNAGTWAVEPEFNGHSSFCYGLPAKPGVYNYLVSVLVR